MHQEHGGRRPDDAVRSKVVLALEALDLTLRTTIEHARQPDAITLASELRLKLAYVLTAHAVPERPLAEVEGLVLGARPWRRGRRRCDAPGLADDRRGGATRTAGEG